MNSGAENAYPILLNRNVCWFIVGLKCSVLTAEKRQKTGKNGKTR